MAEGLLPHTSSSRKKGKQKGFDVFRQPPPRVIAERYNNNRPFSASDSDSSSKSGNGALGGKTLATITTVAQNSSIGDDSRAHPQGPSETHDSVAKRLSDFTGSSTYVTASLRDPVVSVDKISSSQTLAPRDSPSNFVNSNSLQLRKLSDAHAIPSHGSKSVASESLSSARSAFSPVVGVSYSGQQPAPRVPPRVPLHQRPFGKQHKRNSNTCSISGSNASINSAASSTAPSDLPAPVNELGQTQATVSPFFQDPSLCLANLQLSPTTTIASSDGNNLTPENKSCNPNLLNCAQSPGNVKLTSPLQISANNIISAQVSKTSFNIQKGAVSRRIPLTDHDVSAQGPSQLHEVSNEELHSKVLSDDKLGANKSSMGSNGSTKVKVSLDQHAAKSKNGSEQQSKNKIKTLLESGKLSQDTSRLFRSLPMLRQNEQVGKTSNATQSLNRNNFQVMSAQNNFPAGAENDFMQNNSGTETSMAIKKSCQSDDAQLSSQELMERIYSLDWQRAQLLSQIERETQRHTFYAQKFANIRQKKSAAANKEDLDLLKSDAMLLNCKLAEELGVENESQLKSRIEADTEALRRMDQKLIQLFEMFYLLENNSTVPSSDNKTRETQLSGTETQVENAEVVCFAQNGSTVTEQEDKARIDSVGEKAVVSNPQVEMMYKFLGSFNDNNYEEMSKTFFLMSSTPESCTAMRQSGCLPLVIQLIHCELDATGSGDVSGSQGGNKDSSSSSSEEELLLGSICDLMEDLDKKSVSVRQRATEALNNIIHSQTQSKQTNRDIKMLSYLSSIRTYCETVCREYCDYISVEQGARDASAAESHMFRNVSLHVKRLDPLVQLVNTLTKLSFMPDELISFQSLGGIPAVCELLLIDFGLLFKVSKKQPQGANSIHMSTLLDLSTKLRRHVAELLTNMTHKNQAAKSTLIHYSKVMKCLALQLSSKREDLVHVTADLVRNLAWQPERSQIMVLRDLNVVILLSRALVTFNNLMALRAISSALWNLASHCMENRVEICSVNGCLEKIVSLTKLDLSNSCQYGNQQTVYNATGLLSSLCGHIATRGELRGLLRQMKTYDVLLDLCKRYDMPDIVANSVSCLFYLSSRDKLDQEILWMLGAPNILKDLLNNSNSKIANPALGARKNLMQAKSQLRGIQTQLSTNSPNFLNGSMGSPHVNNDPIGSSPVGGGVAKLVRPAVMFDEPIAAHSNVGDPDHFQEHTFGHEGPGSGNKQSGLNQLMHQRDFNVNSNQMKLAQSNGDHDWQKDQYQGDANSSFDPRVVLSNNGVKSSVTFNPMQLGPSTHNANNEAYSSYQEQYAVDRQRRITGFESQQKMSQGQLDDQDKRSVASSQGDDEVVNYTLKYYGSESQADLGAAEVINEDPGFSSYPLSNHIEESDYYEQPTDFSARFPENDAMSTYEELDFSMTSNMSRNIIENNDITGVPISRPPVCFEEVNYEHNEEHNDSMNETLQPPHGAINSPAAVYRQVRFKPADNVAEMNVSSTARIMMLESERRAAAPSMPRGPLESVSSSVHQEQDSEGIMSKKGSATGTPLMGDTPLMFSRRSSISSLGDFETQSINSNSNFASEQGSRAISGAVSPSDIPDSPNEAMMASRLAASQPSSTLQMDGGRNFGNSNPVVSKQNPANISGPPNEAADQPGAFIEEQVKNDFSCASSLSALTFDDDPKVKELANKFHHQFTDLSSDSTEQQPFVQINIPRKLKLTETAQLSQQMAEGNDEAMAPRDWSKLDTSHDEADRNLNEQTIRRISDGDSALLDDEDDDVNLQESNEEDHSVLMEAISSGMPERKPRVKKSSSSKQPSGIKGPSQLRSNSGVVYSSAPYVNSNSGRKSPGLTRSSSGRSVDSNSGRKSPGLKVPGGSSYAVARPQNSYMDLYLRRTSQTESGISSPRGNGGNMDMVKTYQTEGTPLNFSTRTSLSDLSVPDDAVPASGVYIAPQNFPPQSSINSSSAKRNHLAPEKRQQMKSWSMNSPGAGSVSKYSNATGGFDSPKVYNVEGTPASYSRNDSLSSLSCEEELNETPVANVASRPPISSNAISCSGPTNRSPGKLERKDSGRSVSKIPVPTSYRRSASNGSDLDKRSSSSGSLNRSGSGNSKGQSQSRKSLSRNNLQNEDRDSNGNSFEAFNGRSFGDQDEDALGRRRSIGEVSNASSGGDVGLEDRALLNECIYSAMPSSARKSSKSKSNMQVKEQKMHKNLEVISSTRSADENS